jgi:hypothetical protein
MDVHEEGFTHEDGEKTNAEDALSNDWTYP